MKSIAIIGGGAAGVGAAYQLHKRLAAEARITLFEKLPHVGGRSWDVDFAGVQIEVGGVVFHSTGKITTELMQFVGAEEVRPELSTDGKDKIYAFWNKSGFAITCHTTLASMALNILQYVGPFSAWRVTNNAIQMAKKYESIYDLLIPGKPFATPDSLFDGLGLGALSKISTEEYFKQIKVNDRMTDDVVVPINNGMYNQGKEMNALAALIGLAGAGLAGGYLFVVAGGNWKLYDQVCKKIGTDIQLNSQVTQINIPEQTSDDEPAQYTVSTANGQLDKFDAVILAVPPVLADIEFTGANPQTKIVEHPYQKVVTTLVVGDLSPQYFNHQNRGKMPSTILTADSARGNGRYAPSNRAPFKSVGITGYSPVYDSRIYKIFSGDYEVPQSELDEIFTRVLDVHTHIWRGAYPVLTPGIAHLPFELNPGLYFANALETVAGSLEVETVGGTNAANLAANYLQKSVR
jgi:protoporphyrinogen oxidase